jgi:hypothetical protein
MVEDQEYLADDGSVYRVGWALVDARCADDAVRFFCRKFANGVYPMHRRRRQRQVRADARQGVLERQVNRDAAPSISCRLERQYSYAVDLDYYKDQLAFAVCQKWTEGEGSQKPDHINFPVDIPDAVLRQMTIERRREERGRNGNPIRRYWHRSGTVAGELWELMAYGYAALDVAAREVMDSSGPPGSSPTSGEPPNWISWEWFWDYAEREMPLRGVEPR